MMQSLSRSFSNNAHSLWSWAIVLLLFAKSCVGQDTCVKVTDSTDPNRNCKCKMSNGTVIDLSPLVDVETIKPNQALFVNQTGNHGKYSYRPCTPFTTPGIQECTNVAACQYDGNFHNLGTEDSATFVGTPNTDNFYIKYTSGSGEDLRTTHVKLECITSNTPVFTAQGEQATKRFYNFTLQTKFACIGTSPKSNNTLSKGSILLIVFFVLLTVYIVGGILFLRFARGARGIEQIPNVTFWMDLPSLIKDGAMFLFRGCRAEQGYNQI